MPIKSPENKTYYCASEKLIDGRVVRLRPISPSDKNALKAGLNHLSSQSRYFRFFQHKQQLTAKELRFFTEIDFVNHVALVAIIMDKGMEEPVGVGRYIVVKEDKFTEKQQKSLSLSKIIIMDWVLQRFY